MLGMIALVSLAAFLALFVQDPELARVVPAAPTNTAPTNTAPINTAAEGPEGTVAALYDTISGPAGKVRDWDRLRGLFAPDGRMVAMVKGRGGMRPVVLTVEDYVTRAGQGLERDGFFEQEIAQQKQVFGDIAHVFSTYECRHALADEKPFLRGINSIQLVRTGGKWQVLQILWEQEVDAGPIPAEFLVAAGAPKAARGERPAAALPPLAIRVRGSDMMLQMAQQWGKAWPCAETGAAVNVEGGGTGTGFAAFAAGQADVVLASRRPADKELAAARASGTEPVEVCVGHSLLAICVHPDNQISQLQLLELRNIYREGGTLTKWSQLGVTMPAGVSDDIVLVSPQSSGQGFQQFRSQVFAGGDRLRSGTHELAGHADVRDFVRETPNAIGFVDPAYAGAESGVRTVPMSAGEGQPALEPKAAAGSAYALAWPLWVYYRDEPTGRVKAFVRWLGTDDGRALLQRHGFAAAK